jgi:hypothetical protein
MAKKANETSNSSTYILVKGTLLSPSLTKPMTGTHPKDKRKCYRTTIKDPEFKDINETKETVRKIYGVVEDERYIPKWVKNLINDEPIEYINFKSDYELRCKERTREGDIEVDNSAINNGATGYFSIKLLQNDDSVGAYLSSFLMIKNGEDFNPFEGCDF